VTVIDDLLFDGGPILPHLSGYSVPPSALERSAS
jgi:hypothetical protein